MFGFQVFWGGFEFAFPGLYWGLYLGFYFGGVSQMSILYQICFVHHQVLKENTFRNGAYIGIRAQWNPPKIDPQLLKKPSTQCPKLFFENTSKTLFLGIFFGQCGLF